MAPIDQSFSDRAYLAVLMGDPCVPGRLPRSQLALRCLAARGDVDAVVVPLPGERPRTEDVRAAFGLRDVFEAPLVSRHLNPLDAIPNVFGRWSRRTLSSDVAAQRSGIAAVLPKRSYLAAWVVSDRLYWGTRGLVQANVRVVDLIDYELERDYQLTLLNAVQSGASFPKARVKGAIDRRAGRGALLRLGREVDALLVSSEVDRARLGIGNGVCLPNPYERIGPPVGGTSRGSEPTFLFIGTLDYMPNLDALRWLLNDIWPRLLTLKPTAQLRVVGRGSLPSDVVAPRGVTIVGPVERAEPELASAWASVVPLKIGSGTRVKILESWAHRVPVVSTTVGAEGLPVSSEQGLLLADDVEGFARAMVRAVDDVPLARTLTDRGERLWAERFCAPVLEEELHRLLDRLGA